MERSFIIQHLMSSNKEHGGSSTRGTECRYIYLPLPTVRENVWNYLFICIYSLEIVLIFTKNLPFLRLYSIPHLIIFSKKLTSNSKLKS